MTQPALEVHAARGWLRGLAVFSLVLGALAALLVAWCVRIGIDLLDGRFISLLGLITPPVFLVGALILWRRAGWTGWLLRIDDSGIAFRTNSALARLEAPRRIAWEDFARAEVVTGPKAYQGLELRDTKGLAAKVAMSQITVALPLVIQRLEDGLREAGVLFERSGWDVALFDRVVIERGQTS